MQVPVLAIVTAPKVATPSVAVAVSVPPKVHPLEAVMATESVAPV
jgi:hypothetical protein